jgi:predicted transcriptional regulator
MNRAKMHRKHMYLFLPLLSQEVAVTLAELIEEALMTKTEVAAEAGLSQGTVSRMVNGHPTSRLSVRKVLAVLNRKLERHITIDEVEGLRLSSDA